jgi:hypothetical protein
MAGDWIKMRVGLTTNPKVMRLAECLLDDEKYLDWSGLAYGVQGYPPASEDESRNERHAALRVTRYVTVTALLRFWGYANEHEKNENIAGIFPEDVDEIVGVPGFARAIEVAGWATFLPTGGLSLPGFSEHNTSAGARSNGAERQKRYRENRRSEASRVTGKSDVTRDVTVTPREEKRREEKKEQKTTPKGVDLLPGISERIVADFLAIRKAKKQPLTETAVTGIKREAEKAGMTLEQALTESCERGWASFKAAWLTNGTQAVAAPVKKRKQLGEGSSTNYGLPS